MFGYIRKTWLDITINRDTNHTVALDLFKAISFFAGIFYFLVLVPVTYVHVSIILPSEPGFFLVANGFGLSVLKVGMQYLQRKTADDAGNPLATPESVVPPNEPVLMPGAEKACDDPDK